MCTFPVQPNCTFSCTAHFISLHILPLILFHYLFLISFSPYLYIYIYSLVFLFHSFYCFYVIFILLSCFIFLSCTFHWADLSWLTFHYLLYPVWLCMWQIIKNLEPQSYILQTVDRASLEVYSFVSERRVQNQHTVTVWGLCLQAHNSHAFCWWLSNSVALLQPPLLDWGGIAFISCNASCTEPRCPYRDGSVWIHVPFHLLLDTKHLHKMA